MKKFVFCIISVLAIKTYAMEQCSITNKAKFIISVLKGNKSTLINPGLTVYFDYTPESTHIIVSAIPLNHIQATSLSFRQFAFDSFPFDFGVIKPGNYVLEGEQADKVLLKRLDESASKVDK